MTGALSLAVAYGSFLVAENVFHVSGVMSTLVSALTMSYVVKSHMDNDQIKEHDYLWDVIGHIANAFVFIVMGVVITIGMFEERWLAMLIADCHRLGRVERCRYVSTRLVITRDA
jgi:CPA1 family monovalent cation:H+ antiporter